MNLDKWLQNIKENSNECPLILIGNKSDLIKERKISKEQGENFAKKNNIIFLEASAKNDFNVEKSFLKLGEIICNKNENALDKMNKTEYVISKNTTLIKNKKNKDKKNCC